MSVPHANDDAAGPTDMADETAYWKSCETTYLVGPAYYDRQEAALARFLDVIAPTLRTAVDFGCGDGRFSIQIARRCQAVTGYDVGESLVMQANRKANLAEARNVAFAVLDLKRGRPDVRVDLVACMGVLTCIRDDEIVKDLLRHFAIMLHPGGHLILKESLASGKGFRTDYPNGYQATYRSHEEYLQAVAEAGFSLRKSEELDRNPRLRNYLMLFARTRVDG